MPALDSGLSPRVRGNHARQLLLEFRVGSIPACAGEPLHHRLLLVEPEVYPRVCGGTTICSSVFRAAVGLSPRVRGNRHGKGRTGASGRSIPACAGEPFHRLSSSEMLMVYPRVCGGTPPRTPCYRDLEGLSPRVRGNPPGNGYRWAPQRSIPACAGEPHPRWTYYQRNLVYPRVCGGTTPTLTSSSAARGLSPRVRGNLSPPGSHLSSA